MKEDDLNAVLLVAAFAGIAYLLISRPAAAGTPAATTPATGAGAALSPTLPPTDYGIAQDDWG